MLLFCKNILKKLQKRIDEHRKVCYYIIKLRENKQNKTNREGEQNNDAEIYKNKTCGVKHLQ